MLRRGLVRVLVLSLVLLPVWSGLAAPTRIGDQGFLTNPQGAPLNGTVTLAFGLFAGAQGGTSLWSETQNGVTVVDGVYSVELGSQVPLDATVLAGPERWLEVRVNGELMAPRQRLDSVPYALRAQTLDGPALPSLEALQGLPCRVGTPSVGTTQVIFSAGGQSPVSLACVPANSWTLTVTVNRTGSYLASYGHNASVPGPGINCNNDASSQVCSATYPGGTQVTLTEGVGSGWQFQGRSGGCTPSGATCSTTMDAGKSVTATFFCPSTALCAGF